MTTLGGGAVAHQITRQQYRDALTALGFNPDLVQGISTVSDYAQVRIIATDKRGVPVVKDGAPVVEVLDGPILESEAVAE